MDQLKIFAAFMIATETRESSLAEKVKSLKTKSQQHVRTCGDLLWPNLHLPHSRHRRRSVQNVSIFRPCFEHLKVWAARMPIKAWKRLFCLRENMKTASRMNAKRAV